MKAAVRERGNRLNPSGDRYRQTLYWQQEAKKWKAYALDQTERALKAEEQLSHLQYLDGSVDPILEATEVNY